VPIPPDARPPDRLLQGGNTSTITTLVFSPDSHWLASGGYDKTITIWNASTGAEQSSLTWSRSSNDPLTDLVFSPDGKRLASVIGAGEVRIWDWQTGRKVYSVKLRSSWPLLTYSPDGKVWAASVAGAEEDSMARVEIRDAATGNVLRTIPTKWYGVTGMTITRDGLLVASGTTIEDIGDEHDPKGTVQAWDMASGKVVKSSPVFSVVGPLSPDGRFMASIDSSDQAKARLIVTDLSNGQVKWTVQQQNARVAYFSPDAQEIAITNGSERGFNIWSVATGAAISSVHVDRDPGEPGGLFTLAFSPDGKQIAAASYPEFSAKIWDVAAGRELREFAGQFSVQALAMSPDGKWLVSASPGVTVRNPATGKIITTLTIEDADMLLLSPDARWLAANPGPPLGGTGKSLEVWDTRTWTLVANVTPQPEPRQTLPVRWIAFGDNPSTLSKLGDAQSVQFTVDGQTHTVWFSLNPLAASPDGKLLAELGYGYPLNNLDVWDTTSGQKIQSFLAHKSGVQYLAFSRDGRWLLTIGQDAVAYYHSPINEFGVKLWDVATWKERLWVSFPLIRPPSALLSPDGNRLAIERSRELVDFMDADTGRSLGSFAATAPGSFAGWSLGKPNLAFSPDGALLFQGAKDGVRVWKLPLP
jgi:WD40 repeat protein